MFLAGRCVFLLTGEAFFGVLGGLLAAGLEVKWYLDIGPNTVHVFFSVLALYLLLRDPTLSIKTLILAGLALFAAFWSKQLGLAYMVAACCYVFGQHKGKGAALFAGLALLSLAGILYYARLPDSNFLYWVFGVHRNLPMVWSRLWTLVTVDVLVRRYAVLAGFVVAGLVGSVRSCGICSRLSTCSWGPRPWPAGIPVSSMAPGLISCGFFV